MNWLALTLYGLGCILCAGTAVSAGSEMKRDWPTYLLWPLWAVVIGIALVSRTIRK